MSAVPASSRLDQISTRWALVKDPLQFVMRYAPAMHRYLTAILKNPHDVEEVLQDFLVRWLPQCATAQEIVHGFIPSRQIFLPLGQ